MAQDITTEVFETDGGWAFAVAIDCGGIPTTIAISRAKKTERAAKAALARGLKFVRWYLATCPRATVQIAHHAYKLHTKGRDWRFCGDPGLLSGAEGA